MTIKDIAKNLGISYSTVSKCLNNDPKVAEKTRRRVLDEVRRTGFVLNSNAQGLVTKKTRRIGIVFSTNFKETPYRWFFGELETHATRAIEEYGFDFVIQPHNNIRGESNLLRMVSGKQVDGVILFTRDLTRQEYDFLERSRFPHAYGFYQLPIWAHTPANLFWDDNEHGGYIATMHLIQHGHRRILTVRSDDMVQKMYDDRTAGYRRAMLENGLSPQVLLLPMTYEAPKDFLKTRLQYLLGFTAAFVQHDQPALSFIQQLRNNYNVVVPGQLSLVGYNNISAISHFDLPLDTVEDPREAVIRSAVSSLVAQIDGTEDTAIRMWTPRLVVRGSVINNPSI